MTKPIDTTDIRTRLDSQGWAGMHPVDILQLCDEIDRLRGEQQDVARLEEVFKAASDLYISTCPNGSEAVYAVSKGKMDALSRALIYKQGVVRGEKQTPQGKTVDVRVAVGVDHDGYWRAEGWDNADGDHAQELVSKRMDGIFSLYWLTATLPVPAEVTVVAEVSE